MESWVKGTKEWVGPVGGGAEQVTFALDLFGIALYGGAQAQDFLDPTSVADSPLAYKKIPGE